MYNKKDFTSVKSFFFVSLGYLLKVDDYWQGSSSCGFLD